MGFRWQAIRRVRDGHAGVTVVREPGFTFDGETMPHRLSHGMRLAPGKRRRIERLRALGVFRIPHLEEKLHRGHVDLIAEIRRHPRPGQHEKHGPHPQSRRATNTQNDLMRGTSSLDSPTGLS